ncbi:hypothetical protein ACFQO1_09170 [Jejudonia soesokkakensis]|uniref:Uncharacterized protein n=1 Tax=Jejudonia soesokkakensis TaxID=1323432 RepID=A0ABW2MWE1_9FLAO
MMKYILTLLFLIAFSLVVYGYYIGDDNMALKDRCIGLGIVVFFFVWMPVFIYHRWKNKKVKDYMLNKENIEKMRDYSKKKKL